MLPNWANVILLRKLDLSFLPKPLMKKPYPSLKAPLNLEILSHGLELRILQAVCLIN